MGKLTRLDESATTHGAVGLHAGWITATFGLVIVSLALAHVVFQSVKYHLGMPEFYGLVRLFDMGVEANLPTFFSACQLLIVSLLLLLVGLKMRRQSGSFYAGHWLFLALIFFAMAADELALSGAAIFVGGAVGVEMPEAMFVEKNGLDNFTYAMFVLVEETMGMAGILVFLSGLLRYIGRRLGVLAIQVAPSRSAARAAVRPLLGQRPAL